MEKQVHADFTDLIIVHHKIKEVFSNQVKTLINWKYIDTIIGKRYNKDESVTDRPSYLGLHLFKVGLLQT